MPSKNQKLAYMKKIFFLVVTFQLNVLLVLPVFYKQIILQV